MELILPEIISIGIYNSKIAQKGKTISKNRNTNMFEIEMPIEAGGISYMGSESEAITEDMVICAKPGKVRHTKFPYKCYYIHMILNEGELYNILTTIPDFIKPDECDKYREIFKKMCKYYDDAAEENEIILQSLILELIYLLKRDAVRISSPAGLKSGNRGVIEKSIKYIKENLSSDLSLEALSAYIGFSPIYFHNLFKSSVGKSLHTYVEEQRVKKAANMIVTTDLTLTEIAYECGFSSQSYFSYAFKRDMKLTPREYGKAVFERYEAGK